MRQKAVLFANQPTLAFATNVNPQDWIQNYQNTFSAVTSALPLNVDLINLKTLPTGQVILRLHHIFAGQKAILHFW